MGVHWPGHPWRHRLLRSRTEPCPRCEAADSPPEDSDRAVPPPQAAARGRCLSRRRHPGVGGSGHSAVPSHGGPGAAVSVAPAGFAERGRSGLPPRGCRAQGHSQGAAGHPGPTAPGTLRHRHDSPRTATRAAAAGSRAPEPEPRAAAATAPVERGCDERKSSAARRHGAEDDRGPSP